MAKIGSCWQYGDKTCNCPKSVVRHSQQIAKYRGEIYNNTENNSAYYAPVGEGTEYLSLIINYNRTRRAAMARIVSSWWSRDKNCKCYSQQYDTVNKSHFVMVKSTTTLTTILHAMPLLAMEPNFFPS